MSKPIPAVVAVHRINGTILPGTIFTPESEKDLADFRALGAVREPTEAEAALHAKMESNAEKPAGGRGRGRAAQAAAEETAAVDAGEAAAESDIG
jgi:hypothetical protein